MPAVELIQKLQSIAQPYGIGRDIHVGDTIIGIKGRVGFEAAAPLLILKAHHLLEKHTLTKWQMYWKEQIANWYGMMLHEAMYLEPALAITGVARRSGYPEYLVSAVINRRFGCNFWEYINRQRVEAARAHLADADDGRTVLDIAYACGFTSKSTFNAAFKRQVGTTPSAYRRRAAGGPG